MITAVPQTASPATPPKRSSKSYNDLVRTFFTRSASAATATTTTAEAIPPRAPSRIGFCEKLSDESLSLSCSPALQPIPTAAQALDLSPELDDSASDTSDEWSSDIVLLDSMPISYIVTSPSAAAQDVDDDGIMCDDNGDCDEHSSVASRTSDISQRKPYPSSTHLFHHGLSRSALQHQKWLWGARYEEWMQWQSEVEDAAAGLGVYGGIVDPSTIEPPPGLRSRSSSPASLLSSSSSSTPTLSSEKADVNPNIFPRMGELSTLHDPHTARVDRFFGNYSLCTMQKMLFAFNTRCGDADGASTLSGVSSSDMMSEDQGCARSRASSVVSRTSSLKTPPVWERASWDARWEVFQELISLNESTESPTSSSSSLSSSSASSAMPPSSSPVSSLLSTSAASKFSDPSSKRLACTSFGLPVIVRELDTRAEDESNGNEYEDDDHEDTLKPGTSSPRLSRGSHFHFTGANSDDPRAFTDMVNGEDDFCEYDDEDDEDYGEILLNPRFRGPFVTECEVSPDFESDSTASRVRRPRFSL